jgi:pentatricopeptide repeat protein
MDIYKELSKPIKPMNLEESSNKVQALLERLKTEDKSIEEPSETDIYPFDKEYLDSNLKETRQVSLKYLNELLYVNSLGERLPQALEVVKLMQELGYKPNERTYCYLMRAYTNANDLPKAIETFKAIGQANLEYSIFSYNGLMISYIESHRIKDALDVFYKLRASNVTPNQNTFNLLIKGCNDAKLYKKSWELFDYMRLEVCQPDVKLYSQVIKACVINQETERALDIYTEMKESGLLPTQVTLNTLISACASRPDCYRDAFRLAKEMIQDYGFEPDKFTYTALLYASMKAKDLNRTRMLLLKIFESNDEEIKNNPILLSIAILNYSSTIKPANLTLPQINQKLQSKEIEPETNVVDLTLSDIKSLLKNPYPSKISDKALEVEHLFKLAIENIKEDSKPEDKLQLLTSYLTFYTNSNNLEKSLQIFEEVETKYNLTPNGYQFNLLLQLLFRYKQEEQATELWAKFDDWYTTQMDLISEKSNSERHHYMKTNGITNREVYDMYLTLINGYARTLRLDLAFEHLIKIQKLSAFKSKLKLRDFKTLYYRIYQYGDQEMMFKLYELVPSTSMSLEKSKNKLITKWKGKISKHQQFSNKRLKWEMDDKERYQKI